VRAREFVVESDYDDVVEDEAVVRGDDNLAAALEQLRNESHDTHDVPMVRVDSLLNMVRNLPGSEMFTVENLLDAYKTNDTIKNLIKDIKDNKDGVKYVYLATFADDPNSGDDLLATAGGMVNNPEKTIDSMAKRALSKRS
jgi:hypothetical protein